MIATGYSTGGWENFFFAELGASAALVGLLFVAVSISLAKILGHTALPGRAFESLLVLAMVLFTSSFALVPGQSTTALGVELLITGFIAWGGTLAIQVFGPKQQAAPLSWVVSRITATQVATLPMVIGSVSLMVGRGGGLYWTVAAVMGSFLAALIDSWVLLVEIHR